MTVDRVGVIGAGTIGRGVAQSFATAGFDVVLVDVAPEQLTAAVRQIGRDLLVLRMLPGHGVRAADPADVLGRIRTAAKPAALADVDFVVENVTEDWAVKRAVYREIDAVCRPDVVFGVNTSAVPITRVGSVTGRADRVIGLHFMNPVPMLDTVEVVCGTFTSAETTAESLDLLGRLGKTGIVVRDAPGFVTNRVLMPTINEAAFCVQDGVATAEQVDQMFQGCFGHPMGPLRTADLIGLDTVLNSIIVLYESYRDSKYRPAPLLVRLVEAGLLGRKTGHGFHAY